MKPTECQKCGDDESRLYRVTFSVSSPGWPTVEATVWLCEACHLETIDGLEILNG